MNDNKNEDGSGLRQHQTGESPRTSLSDSPLETEAQTITQEASLYPSVETTLSPFWQKILREREAEKGPQYGQKFHIDSTALKIRNREDGIYVIKGMKLNVKKQWEYLIEHTIHTHERRWVMERDLMQA
jgi:hypothetical protein